MRLLAALLLMLALPAWSHEVRPAYLELRETASGSFSVLWKVPARGDQRLELTPLVPVGSRATTAVQTQWRDNAVVQVWHIVTQSGLRGESIAIGGLERTLTDALVRIEFADGSSWVKRLTPDQTSAQIPQQPGPLAVMYEYFVLGVEHILLGIDHLLFVLGLLLITQGWWKLIQTITAFTLAHSITLAAATLQLIRLPVAPVEAVIALSIVFVACERIYQQRGETTLAQRAPWIVALLFGLLHGLGFAAALGDVGLPQQHIPLALLFFNVGVEVGQLVFVAAVLGIAAIARPLWQRQAAWLAQLPAYAIGSVAMFWVFERVAAF